MSGSDSFVTYIEHAPLPMVVTQGTEHIVRSVNLAFRNLAGGDGGPPAGRPVAEVLPACASPQAAIALVDQVYRSGEARTNVEIEHVHTGVHRVAWWSYTVWPVVANVSGRPEGLILQIRDVTRQHRNRSDRQSTADEIRDVNEQLLIASIREEELATQARAAERRATFLAEASAVLASSLDMETMLGSLAKLTVPFLADWCIVHLAAESGHVRQVVVADSDSRKEALSRDLEAQLPLQHIVHGVLEHGEPVLFPTISPTGPGSGSAEDRRLRIELTVRSGLAVPILIEGRIAGVITLVISESDRRYGEDEVALAQALARLAALAVASARRVHELEAASQAKSRFLATMSHELRTPLTAIMGYEALLADGITGPVTEAQRRQLGRIKLSATHLLGLIDEVLTLSRVEAGSEAVQCETVDVRVLLNAATTLVEPLAATKHLTLAVSAPERELTLETDPARVRQILVNLLGNAIKFTERGEITLCARADTETVTFVVRDTGIGISPEHLERIFEPFWQVEQEPTRKAGGTGLGLSVSRRLARLLGGDLTVASSVGEGATFTLTMPIAAPCGGGAQDADV